MNSKTEVDISGAMAAFEALHPKQLRSATRSAFAKSGNIMKKAAQTEYKAAFPGSVLYRDIHMKAFRNGMGVVVDLVYLRNHPKGDKLYKSYILPMLELGTIERYTGSYGGKRASKYYNEKSGKYEGIDLKRSNYRGKISGSGFFGRGVSGSIGRAMSELSRNIEDAITRKAKKVGAI